MRQEQWLSLLGFTRGAPQTLAVLSGFPLPCVEPTHLTRLSRLVPSSWEASAGPASSEVICRHQKGFRQPWASWSPARQEDHL